MASLFHPVGALVDKISRETDVDVRYMLLRDLSLALDRLESTQFSVKGNSHVTNHAEQENAGTMLSPLDGTTQSKLCKVLLTQLVCSQGEVDEAAMKCIPGMLSSVGESAVMPLLSSLLLHCLDPKTALPPVHLDSEEMADERDREARLESLRLKAMNAIRSVWSNTSNPAVESNMAKTILPPILQTLTRTTNKDAKDKQASSTLFQLPIPILSNAQLLDFVTFLHAFLSCHPASIIPFHADLLQAFHSLVLFPSSGLLKLTLECVSDVAPHLSRAHQQTFVSSLTGCWSDIQLRKRETAYFQAIAIVIKVLNNQIQPQIQAIVALISQVVQDAQGRYDSREEDKESALLCLDAILRFAAAASLPTIHQSFLSIIRTASQFDPNFVGEDEPSTNGDKNEKKTAAQDDYEGSEEDYGGGGDDEEEDFGMNDDEDNDEDALLVDAYVDGGEEVGGGEMDDDESDRVRSAAIRCCQSLMNLISIGSGVASDLQNQAAELSLPRAHMQAHAVQYRPMLIQLAQSLSDILVSRLYERKEYIQIEILNQFQQLLQWTSRIQLSEPQFAEFFSSPTTAASSSSTVTFASQLNRLLNQPIHAKLGASSIQKIQAVLNLMQSALKMLPASQLTHASFSLTLSLLATRGNELVSMLPSNSSLAPLIQIVLSTMEQALQRLDVGKQLLAWDEFIQRCLKEPFCISPAGVAVGIAALRASTALLTALPTYVVSFSNLSNADASIVLPVTQVDRILNSTAASVPISVSNFVSDAHCWPAVEKLSQSLAGLFSSAQLDRQLLLHAVTAFTTLHQQVLSPILSHASAFPPQAVQVAKAITERTDINFSNVISKLLEQPSSRLAASECLSRLLRFNPASLSLLRVETILPLMTALLKQRDRALLHAALLSLHSYSLRSLCTQKPSISAAVEAEQFKTVVVLQELCVERDETLQLEQFCALFVLSNLLHLLSATSASRDSVASVFLQHLHPALHNYANVVIDQHQQLQQQQQQQFQHASTVSYSTLRLQREAIEAMYSAGVATLSSVQFDQLVASCKQEAVDAKEHDKRSFLAHRFATLLLARVCESSRQYFDLDQQQFWKVQESQIDLLNNSIQTLRVESGNSQASESSRFVALLALAPLMAATGSLQVFRPSVAPSPEAWAEFVGYLSANVPQLVNEWKQNEQSFSPLLECLRSLPWMLSRDTPLSRAHPFVAQLPSLLQAIWKAIPSMDVNLAVQLLLQTARLDLQQVLQLVKTEGFDHWQQQSTSSDAQVIHVQHVVLLLLQALITQHLVWNNKWHVLSSSHFQPFSSLCTLSLENWRSTDLQVLTDAATLFELVTSCSSTLSEVSQWTRAHAMQFLTHMKTQLASKHSKEVSYGPSTRVIDTGVELRSILWKAMAHVIQGVWHNATLHTLDAASHAKLEQLCVELFIAGLNDSATDVLLLVHAMLPSLLTRVELEVQQWSAISGALLITLRSSPPQNAVREEMLTHAEALASASKIASHCIAVLRANSWPSPTEQVRQQLETIASELEAAVQNPALKREQDLASS